MQRLRREHQRQVAREQGGHHPAQDRDGDAERHQALRTETCDQSRRLPEHDDLDQHADAPQCADRRTIVACGLQMQGVENIERAKAHLHQQRDQQEATHARPFPQVLGVVDGFQVVGWAVVAMWPRGRDHRHEQRNRHPRETAVAQSIQQPAVGRGNDQEADRSPDANAAILGAARAQCRQRHRFELRHHRVVEQPEAGHHRQQCQCAVAEGESGEAQGGQRTADDEPVAGTRASLKQRTPQRRCKDSASVPQAQHGADHIAVVAHRIDPAADIGRVGTQRGVVAEVEDREPAQVRSHAQNSRSSAAQR